MRAKSSRGSLWLVDVRDSDIIANNLCVLLDAVHGIFWGKDAWRAACKD